MCQINQYRRSRELTQEAVDLTVPRAEHPHAAAEAVVGEERNVGGEHDEVRQGEVHHQDVGGGLQGLESGREKEMSIHLTGFCLTLPVLH